MCSAVLRRITRKSGKLAEVANERDFHRMAEAVQSRGGALGRGQGGRLRSRSRSPGGVFMHVAPPSTLYDSAHHPDHQDGQVPERPSWDILKSTELLQNEGMHHGSTGGAGRRERSDSVVSTNSERSSSIRGDRRRHSSLNAGQQASHEAPRYGHWIHMEPDCPLLADRYDCHESVAIACGCLARTSTAR